MLIPAISFPGNCNEALDFYKTALGAVVKDVAYFRDAPPDSGMDESLPPDFVMHSEVSIYGTFLTMTDGGKKRITGDNFSMMIMLNTTEEVTAVFNKLADGGKAIEALAPQFWASLAGTVEDRFGVNWCVLTSS